MCRWLFPGKPQRLPIKHDGMAPERPHCGAPKLPRVSEAICVECTSRQEVDAQAGEMPVKCFFGIKRSGVESLGARRGNADTHVEDLVTRSDAHGRASEVTLQRLTTKRTCGESGADQAPE